VQLKNESFEILAKYPFKIRKLTVLFQTNCAYLSTAIPILISHKKINEKRK